MNKTSRFVYVTFIRATPQKVWDAFTKPEQTRRYWHGVTQVSDWTPGADWKMTFADGRIADAGRVVEIDPPRRLVLEWRNEFMPELKAEGFSRLTYLLEPQGEMVKLTVTHEMPHPGSEFIEKVSGGWPIILSSLKSLLETGESLEATRRWPEGV